MKRILTIAGNKQRKEYDTKNRNNYDYSHTSCNDLNHPEVRKPESRVSARDTCLGHVSSKRDANPYTWHIKRNPTMDLITMNMVSGSNSLILASLTFTIFRLRYSGVSSRI